MLLIDLSFSIQVKLNFDQTLMYIRLYISIIRFGSKFKPGILQSSLTLFTYSIYLCVHFELNILFDLWICFSNKPTYLGLFSQQNDKSETQWIDRLVQNTFDYRLNFVLLLSFLHRISISKIRSIDKNWSSL